MGPLLPVQQLDPDTGKLLKTWPSAALAARTLANRKSTANNSTVTYAVRNKARAYGYRWRYAPSVSWSSDDDSDSDGEDSDDGSDDGFDEEAIYQQPSGAWIARALGSKERFSSRKAAAAALAASGLSAASVPPPEPDAGAKKTASASAPDERVSLRKEQERLNRVLRPRGMCEWPVRVAAHPVLRGQHGVFATAPMRHGDVAFAEAVPASKMCRRARGLRPLHRVEARHRAGREEILVLDDEAHEPRVLRQLGMGAHEPFGRAWGKRADTHGRGANVELHVSVCPRRMCDRANHVPSRRERPPR